MIKLITTLLVFVLTAPAFAGGHCFISRSHCYVKPAPVETVTIPGQKIEQTVKNNIQVTNNLIMPLPLAPLVIETPPLNDPASLRRPFSFQNNMPGRQQSFQQKLNPFIGLVVTQNTGSAFIINNIVNRTTTTTTKSGVTTTTSSSSQTAPQTLTPSPSGY